MASKSKRRRKVLGASCILAALIIAGSSFAWFTSKDEVTNRLTATADYGVSIVEDFKPPKDMTPGQEVNKDVSVVNTGSIDAFVRASLSEKMDMSRLNSLPLDTATSANNIGTTYYKTASGEVKSVVMDDKDTTATLGDAEIKLYDLKGFGDPSTGNGLPTLPTAPVTEFVELDPQEKIAADGSKMANEVTTLMAGGQVVVAQSKAVAPDSMAVRSGDDVNGKDKYDIIYDVKTGDSAIVGKKVIYDSASSKYYEVKPNQDGLYEKQASPLDMTTTPYTLEVFTLARDYSGAAQYKPTGTGLYIFKRNDTKYSGFYYVGGAAPKFYALQTEENNKLAYIDFGTGTGITYDAGNLVVDSIDGVKLRTKETGIDNTKGEWKLEFIKVNAGKEPEDASTTTVSAGSEDTATHLKATFHVDSDSTDHAKDVIFYVKLADNWSDSWQYVADESTNTDKKDGNNDNGLGYFYYKTLLDSGVTSAPLIDSVKLNKDMNSANYLDMVYDLNVALDSAQVTKDQYGNETAEAVEATLSNTNTTKWATPTLTKDAATTGTPAGDGVPGTIDYITWG